MVFSLKLMIRSCFAFNILHRLQITLNQGLVFPIPPMCLCDPITFFLGRPSLLLLSLHFLFVFPLGITIQLSRHPAILHREFLINKWVYITIGCFSQLSVTGQILASINMLSSTEFSEGTLCQLRICIIHRVLINYDLQWWNCIVHDMLCKMYLWCLLCYTLA